MRESPLKSVQVREWKAKGESGIVVDGIACRGESDGERITLAMKHRDGVGSACRPFEDHHERAGIEALIEHPDSRDRSPRKAGRGRYLIARSKGTVISLDRSGGLHRNLHVPNRPPWCITGESGAAVHFHLSGNGTEREVGRRRVSGCERLPGPRLTLSNPRLCLIAIS